MRRAAAIAVVLLLVILIVVALVVNDGPNSTQGVLTGQITPVPATTSPTVSTETKEVVVKHLDKPVQPTAPTTQSPKQSEVIVRSLLPTATPPVQLTPEPLSTSKPTAPAKQQIDTPPVNETVNGLAWRGSGVFYPGEAVVGYEIELNGLKARLCYVPYASAGGVVKDGSVNPYPGDVVYPECANWVSDPDTVNGMNRRLGAGDFNAGEAVTGFFTINEKSYGNCYMKSAPAGGTIVDGVVNPWPGEIAPECHTDTVNGKDRRGPGAFSAGEAVTGYFTMGDKSFPNCYLKSAPMDGIVTDGVVNPWEKEIAAPCS